MNNNHLDDDSVDVEEQRSLVDSDDGLDDERTPLDKTIDRIGMGTYQWALLSLCGFGWMADNMWIQAIAIILPRVQQHYSVPDSYIGSVSSSMFAGMMLGAVGWGTCSDLLGRSTAFNATLFFTSIFGFVASLVDGFVPLCIALFFLGTAVGGSMPTDGTLLLEHMPKEKQYLVTALSIFFSFGSVLSAFVALIVLPGNSCPSNSSSAPASVLGLTDLVDCDVGTQNRGWKYLLMTLALITLSMFLARMVLFRLHESPRYLVHAGRPLEAVKSLKMISKFNGSDLEIELDDVADHHPATTTNTTSALPPSQSLLNGRPDSTVITGSMDDRKVDERVVFDAGDEAAGNAGSSSPTKNSTDRSTLVPSYNAVGETASNVLEGHSFKTPLLSNEDVLPREIPKRSNSDNEDEYKPNLGSGARKPLAAWWDRVSMVLEPEWFRTTVLVWAVWGSMSLAFTMFNVFLPKLLELGPSSGEVAKKTLEDNLWDVMIFTIGGTPGAILGAWLIESSLGRRLSLAASTFITAVFCVVFIMVESTWAVRLSTMGVSLSATAMWAVLYGWTPEIFGTKVRGTACGIASALSRIGGMIAPLLGGTLLMISRAVPVYTSVGVFTVAGICVLLLREGEGASFDRTGKGRRRATKVVVH
ncbi:hypothetical protein AGABI1DRAFT_74699 [Agaricus bisporus var. burnettii JB137-S8]|uniref:Major facilitator superfamily (MFS) profile domain-containing protein n=1 Tax=Agaricus bisporus var. burnettii (strain JB137-S8 / ATCC MYA-4627 / FGSC 10392) TaxID=597362 RepID=K5WVX0_AGABU|nr:uncharacterized protein AGABI1DRAFT_74699 [Agaricus bisporus var. burnettii JB137-S8]EKM79586.1 hypothetical protein AGABI1DRAFT_74699 [Agaricus bisporus var. burnettii JB137-S8]